MIEWIEARRRCGLLSSCLAVASIALAGCGSHRSTSTQASPLVSPEVETSVTGFVIRNQAPVPLENVRLVLDAQRPGDNSVYEFNKKLGRLSVNQVLSVSYADIGLRPGGLVNGKPIRPVRYRLMYGDDKVNGSLSVSLGGK